MKLSAKLVGDGVVKPQPRLAERHAGERRGVVHFPARRHAVAFFHRGGQILKHQFGGFFRQRVGKVAGVRRDPRLQRVS